LLGVDVVNAAKRLSTSVVNADQHPASTEFNAQKSHHQHYPA
jgi:hypothetical protein